MLAVARGVFVEADGVPPARHHAQPEQLATPEPHSACSWLQPPHEHHSSHAFSGEAAATASARQWRKASMTAHDGPINKLKSPSFVI